MISSLQTLLETLSENLNTKGQRFELCCKWFLENDAEYSQLLKKVWLWNDWPGKWGRDKGIDLIAQTYDDEIWAIQVKAYDEKYDVTKTDIDSFLSESNRSEISFRLLIATTNKVGGNAREVIHGQEKSINLCLRDRLENCDLDWMESLRNRTPIKKFPKTPRPHQEVALADVIKGFETCKQGQLYMACGTGKSLIGLWLAQRLQSQKTLVLVPSLSLVEQLHKTWAENRGDFEFDPILVCSDATVAKKDEDDYQDTMELGFPVTTAAADIVKYCRANSRRKVIFSTYQSSQVIQQACALDATLMFDLVIADEAHRCAGKAKSEFAIITHNDAIRADKKLYMTATPRIYSEHVKKKTKECEVEIVSMDDETKFGPVFHKLLFSDAIKQDLLSDYQVLISVMDNAMYRDYTEKGRIVTLENQKEIDSNHETDARTVASQILMAKVIKQYGLKKVITFHNSVKTAKEFITTLPRAVALLPDAQKPDIGYTKTIFGDMPQSQRSIILKQFADPQAQGASIIANVKCLSEGVDVPALDGIVFVDPKGSEIDIIQAVGRAIRTSPDKKIGTMVIPIFVDSLSDEIADLEKSCFKKVWQIVRALRSHDDVLAEELDNMRLELGKRTYKTPPKLGKIIIDVPASVGPEFAEALSVKIVDRCTLVSLHESHPEIAQQWHPIKNEKLTPRDVTFGMSKKIWWKCDKGNDHEWQSIILNRTSGYGCPICTNQLTVLSNCLATTHPEIAKQWHFTKNEAETPYDIVAGSGKKRWWKCDKGDDHEWSASVEKRTRDKNGCPVCSGNLIVLSTCLATTHPDLVKQWHLIKNNEMTPFQFGAGSEKKIWWQCEKSSDHEWLASINHRVYGTGCAVCDNKKVVKSNSLIVTYPEVAKQWHPSKNGTLTPDNITSGSNEKVWWQCPKEYDHEWQTSVVKRIPMSLCPACINRLVVTSNCLLTTHSEIAQQWHSIKNGDLKPSDVTSVSNKKVWWQCVKNHELLMKIRNRVAAKKCKLC